MTRQSRLVVVLLAMAGLGIGGLTLVANQYRRTLAGPAGRPSGPEDGAARAARLVDGFLAARGAAKAVIARYPGASAGNEEASRAYRRERQAAYLAHGMTHEDYAAVRRAWRAWKTGNPVNDPAIGEALSARREALVDATLGAAEEWDDSIR